jgi:hypothetical protein
MSTLSLAPSARPPVPVRWTMWLIWRQQRGNLAGITALAGVISVLLLIAVSELGHADALGLHTCLANGTGRNCATAMTLMSQGSQQLRNAKVALLIIPAIIGMFTGAPLIAREHETGTTGYSWTQGLAPERLLGGTLVLNGAIIAAVTACAGLLFNWATGLAELGMGFTVSPSTFAAQFPVLPAWSVFAYVLGVACGALIHRTVLAMAATLLSFGGVLYLAREFLRPHYAALVIWTHYPSNANLFWPYQAIESLWLLVTTVVLASALIASPRLFRSVAWRRAARHEIGRVPATAHPDFARIRGSKQNL